MMAARRTTVPAVIEDQIASTSGLLSVIEAAEAGNAEADWALRVYAATIIRPGPL
jgi:hypothetical protein